MLLLSFQAVSELPQPNRDTMAFIMLHLQKVCSILLSLESCPAIPVFVLSRLISSIWQVAAAKETKMNLSNLAKILGPTIIGYSSMEALPEEIMKEVGAFRGVKI